MLLYIRLLKESFSFAINALRNNKLRTFLSLLGVTVGIFSIIAVLAAVDSLDKTITSQLSSLDSNTMYLANMSFGPTDVPRWKRETFDEITYNDVALATASHFVSNGIVALDNPFKANHGEIRIGGNFGEVRKEVSREVRLGNERGGYVLLLGELREVEVLV